MAEKKKSFGSKKGGFKPRTGGSKRPPSRKRPAEGRQGSANYRAPAPRKSGVPTAAVVAIVIPCVVIIVLLFSGSMFKSTPEVVVNDPNTRIKQLESKVKSFQNEWRKVRKQLVEDGERGEASAERLSDRMQDWLVEWNDEMKPYQDADGYMKEGFKGYSRTRSEVSKILYDLNKSKGF